MNKVKYTKVKEAEQKSSMTQLLKSSKLEDTKYDDFMKSLKSN
jgi:hypothetical protein